MNELQKIGHRSLRGLRRMKTKRETREEKKIHHLNLNNTMSMLMLCKGMSGMKLWDEDEFNTKDSSNNTIN